MTDNGGREESIPGSLFQDIGKIQKGIENLEGGQEEVNNKVSGLHQQMSRLVTKDECEGHRAEFEEQLAPEAPAPSGLLERMGKNAKSITAIIILGSLAGGLLLGLSRVIGSVEALMTTQRQEQKAATKRVLQQLQKPPVIIHQPILVYPDAGPPPRRRMRTPRRRPRTRRPPAR